MAKKSNDDNEWQPIEVEPPSWEMAPVVSEVDFSAPGGPEPKVNPESDTNTEPAAKSASSKKD